MSQADSASESTEPISEVSISEEQMEDELRQNNDRDMFAKNMVNDLKRNAELRESPRPSKKARTVPDAPKKKRSKAAAETAAKHWCFTLNNPMGDDEYMYDIVKEWPTSYLVFQREVGDKEETTHLQGYCEFEKPMRFGSLRKLPFGGMFTWKLKAATKLIFIIK